MTRHEQVSETVAAALELHGMNRKQLAAQLGHPPSWVTRKLAGDLRWSIDDVDALADVFGMPFGAFFIERARAATRKLRALLGARYLRVARGLEAAA